MAASTGILNPYTLTNQSEAETRIDAYAREVYLSNAPLLLTLPTMPAPGDQWTVTGETVRPQTAVLNAAIGTGDATITLVDATPFQIGDVLQIFNTAGTSTERVLVTSLNSSTVLGITRAFEGTTAVANTPGSFTTVQLIGTASTGSEIDKVSFRNQPTTYTQRLQTFMYRASVGGMTQAMPNVALPNGMMDTLAAHKRVKTIECLRDAQRSMYYGLGQTRNSVTQRPTQLGIKGIITTYSSALNVTTSTAASYTQLNFMADLIQKAVDGGGDPDLLVCSTNWMTAFATWSNGKQYFQEKDVTPGLGIPIERMYFAFGGKKLEIVYDYGLISGTAMVLSSKDIKVAEGRPLMMKPVGSRGDADEVDVIADWSLEVGHPGFHAWREGVTGFA